MTCRPDTATSPDPALGLLETFVGREKLLKTCAMECCTCEVAFPPGEIGGKELEDGVVELQNDWGLARTLDLENLMKKWGLSIKDGDLTIKNGGLREYNGIV